MPGSGRLHIDNYVLFALWIAAILRIFWPYPQLVLASGIILLIYVVLSFRRIRLQLQILSLLLALAALALAVWLDAWAALWQGMEKAVIFSAFFGTLTLMRATADLRPEIGRARKLVEPLSAGARISGLLVGTNVLGTALIVGVMPIFAPIIGHDAPYEVRKSAAEACQRGMCRAFSPVLPPVALAAAAVLGLNAVTPLTTLQCLVVGIPVLCICSLLAQSIDHLRVAVRQAGRSVGTVRGEIALLTCAFALGKVLEQALQAGGIGDQITAMAPPPYAVIATVVIGMTVLGLAGIHQVVTATVMLVLFGTLPIGVSDLALMQAGLLGWAFSSMTGLSAVSVAAASTMFNVPLERVAYGPNIRFVAVFGLLGIAVVTCVNWIMMP
jgi:hypothetical protein